MAKVLIVVVIAAVIFWVVSVVDCAVQPLTRHRGVSKPTWVAIVILLPVIGGILWFTLGRTRASQTRQSAPDDDIAFLSSLNAARIADAEQEERIRKLEEELAKLDDEDTHPRGDDGNPHTSDDGEDSHGARP